MWGKEGMKELWGAATVKLFGPGADDAGWAEEMSRLIGEHDVDTVSYSTGRHGQSRSAATRKERIIPPDALRAMQKGTAVLLATGVRPAVIATQPWYRGPLADRVAAAESRATAK